jgi:hypothetical protein
MAELTVRGDIPKHRVSVSAGYTKNMGDFESLRVDVGLEIDGKPGETPEQTYLRAAEWVEKKLVDKVDEVTKELES